MPLYDYTCRSCAHRFSWIVGMLSDATKPTCPQCGAKHADRRAVYAFASVRSDAQALDDLDRCSIVDPSDPASMLDWSQRLGAVAGRSDGLGDEFNEYIEAASESSPSEFDTSGEDAL